MTKESLIGELFFLRDIAHLRHLCTSSYAEHVALQEFYESIVGLADDYVEIIQRKNTVDINVPTSYTSMVEGDGRLLIYFEAFKNQVKTVEHTFTRSENNIMDDIVSLIDKTTYKLNNLV